MDKENKNRSGSQSNDNNRSENKEDRQKTSQPGAPQKKNRKLAVMSATTPAEVPNATQPRKAQTVFKAWVFEKEGAEAV